VALTLTLGLLVMVTACLVVSPGRALAYDSCIDSFDCYKLDVAANNSQPFTQHDLTLAPITTDVTGFTLQSGEHTDCPLNNGDHRWGDHSAWYRIDGGVAGTVDVSANTQLNGSQGFPIFMILWESSHDDPIDYTNTSDLRNVDCSAVGTNIAFNAGEPVFPNGPTFVQVLTYCGDATSSPCTGNESTGPVQLQFSFHCTDGDGDGVCDTVDQCPTVAANTSTGCAATCPDSDGDKVCDSSDPCPTVAGSAADEPGCPDSDGDGIADKLDPCPTVAGHAADLPGCPDTDHDGIADKLDPCPTVAGNAADQPGCPDTDHDGIATDLDGCPTVAGHSTAIPGCPDSDGDGLPDKVDACPHQSGALLLGGCPDSDHDGVPNRRDRCPHTYARFGFSTYGDGRLGCPQPLAAQININWGAPQSHSTDLTTLAPSIPRGARLIVQCAGSQCPRRTLLNIIARAKAINLRAMLLATPLAHGHKLPVPVGDRLLIIVTFKGTAGLSWTFVPRRSAQPTFVSGCAAQAGRPRVARCPS
jgi:hypothetical protein